MKKSDNRRGIRMRFTAFALTVAVLAAAAVALVGRSVTGRVQERVRNTTVQVIGELTGSKAKILKSIINETEADLLFLAESLEAVQEEAAKVRLVKGFEKEHNTEALALLDYTGKYVYGSEKELALNGVPDTFGAAVSLNSAAMSDAVLGQKGRRQILFGVMLADGGRIYAAVTGEALQEAYGEATYGGQGYSYIVENSGKIILPPISYSYEQVYDNIENILKEENNDAGKLEAFMKALKEGRTGSVVFSFDGQEQLLCFEPLEVKQNWQIITVVPLTAVEEDGAEIIRMSMYLVGIIAAALLLLLSLGLLFYSYTQRKQRENDRFLRNIYKAISENIDTVIFIMDEAYELPDYVFENSGRLLGIPSGDFMSGSGAGESAFREQLRELLRRERPSCWREVELQIFNDCLDREMWLKILICPFELSGRRKYIYAVTDMTQENLAREKIAAAMETAKKANAAKSQFLTSMSHDIRTPMNGIVGMTAIARMNLHNPEKVEDCLNKIDMSSKLLLGLINDVLDMSRIESGRMNLVSEPVDLRELLEGLETMLKPQCDARHQELKLTIQADHTAILGDQIRLSQIFTNLLSNAVKFTPDGGKIEFTAQELERSADHRAEYRFVVSDTGIGMKPEFIQVIFQPFERADSDSVRRTEGTGLGMAITQNLVSAMGGSIRVESEPGEGSSFTVELKLPLQEPGAREDCREQPQETFNYSGRRFLLAEDNEINREIVEELLGQYSASVESAENGKQAVELFLSHASGYYDAVLMDIQMPVMNGYDATRAIRSSGHPQARDIPVIAMTADAFAEDIRTAREAGMNAHVAKPVDVTVLSEVLREVVR